MSFNFTSTNYNSSPKITQNRNTLVFTTPYGTLDVIFSVIILMVNIPLIVFLLKSKHLRIKPSNHIFLNVQLTHVIYAALIVPVQVIKDLSFARECSVITQGLIMVSLMSMALLTYERLHTLNNPLSPINSVIKSTIPILGMFWISSSIFVVLALRFDFSRYSVILTTVLVFVAGVGFIVANFKICRKAKCHIKFVTQNGHCRKIKKIGNMLKGSFICCAVVSSYVITWFPYFIRNVFMIVGVYNPHVHGKRASVIVYFITRTNSLADPLMFIILSATVMDKIKKMTVRVKFNKSSNVLEIAKFAR